MNRMIAGYIFIQDNELVVDEVEIIKGSTYPEDMPLEKQQIPYFIEFAGTEVISITEEFMYTI